MEKVLIVEDSRAFRMLVEYEARQHGLATVAVACMADAEVVLNQDIDFLCAVLDYNLPDAQHGEVIDLCLANHLKVIVLTASQTETIRKQVLAKPVIDYIPKDSSHCVQAVCQLLLRLSRNKDHQVLIVDDSPSVRKHVAATLERQYLKVHEANDGEQALSMLSMASGITLVITDYAMPNMDGIALVHQIRKHHEGAMLAIIGLSGHHDDTLTTRFLKAGANDYLQKPFNQEEFYCRVHSCLNAIDSERRLFTLANTDFLTALWNRRYFFSQSEKLPDEEIKHLAIIDIDHFKRINDQYGHHVGDEVLSHVAATLSAHFENDLVARLGGEEFCVLSTREQSTFQQALERYRQEQADVIIPVSGFEITVTVSIGVVSAQGGIEAMLHDADRGLYQAKEMGRNCLIALS
ncbi:response regulator [Salinivibrio sp. SS2]|uniref:response regulator n=1 Tax=Salinivibrio sp. SS2 TaxID=1892894 RepID=UPI0020C76767|nr:response regulator [Salinivibrio sp. DV]